MKKRIKRLASGDRSPIVSSHESYAEFCPPGASVSEQMMGLADGVHLRIVSFYPAMKSPYPPIVMVPGLASVMLTFKNVLIGLTKHFVVHYVETRENSLQSSRLMLI
jgi:hypothetical protein